MSFGDMQREQEARRILNCDTCLDRTMLKVVSEQLASVREELKNSEKKLDTATKALEKYSITSSYYVHSTVTGNAKRDCAKKKPVEMAEIARQALKEIKGQA